MKSKWLWLGLAACALFLLLMTFGVLAAVSLLGDPGLALGELVTHTFPLSEFRQAFELAEFGKERAMKVAFVF